MNPLFQAVILSPEFIAESRKTGIGRAPREHREKMIEVLNWNAYLLGIVPDEEDRQLQECFIAGDITTDEIALRIKHQLVGRTGRKR